MKRTSPVTIGAIGFVVLVLGLTWCANPFKHFDHTGGIAYYKQGLLPYVSKEIAWIDAPFTVEGNTTTDSMAGVQVAVIPVNADSVGLTFVFNGKHYSYIQQTGRQLTTGLFSIRVTAKLGNWPLGNHDIYYFKFVNR